jgi:hypothetical protein
MSQNDLTWPVVAGAENGSEKKQFEREKQKYRKVNEELKDEKEQFNANTREYFHLIQSSTDRAQRNKVQAIFDKQKENHTKKLTKLTKKVDGYRNKLNELIRSAYNNETSPARHTIAAIQQTSRQNIGNDSNNREDSGTIRHDSGFHPRPKLKSNRSSKSNLGENHEIDFEDKINENHLGVEEIESKLSSNRASIIQDDSCPELQNETDNPDIESVINEGLKALEAKLKELGDRVDTDLTEDIRNLRTDCIHRNNLNTENEERIEERINNLESELFEANDNHNFETNNLKSMISELQEKLEYDCRRMNREFSEKLDNVYECIEKLELGREKKEENKRDQNHESAEALKDLVVNVVLGIFALVFYILNTIQAAISPFTRSSSRTVLSFVVLLISIVVWNSSEFTLRVPFKGTF